MPSDSRSTAALETGDVGAVGTSITPIRSRNNRVCSTALMLQPRNTWACCHSWRLRLRDTHTSTPHTCSGKPPFREGSRWRVLVDRRRRCYSGWWGGLACSLLRFEATARARPARGGHRRLDCEAEARHRRNYGRLCPAGGVDAEGEPVDGRLRVRGGGVRAHALLRFEAGGVGTTNPGLLGLEAVCRSKDVTGALAFQVRAWGSGKRRNARRDGSAR